MGCTFHFTVSLLYAMDVRSNKYSEKYKLIYSNKSHINLMNLYLRIEWNSNYKYKSYK